LNAANPATVVPATGRRELDRRSPLGLWEDLENRAADRLKRAVLRFLDPTQVLVDVRGGTPTESTPGRYAAMG
jgi:hypothetical protein